MALEVMKYMDKVQGQICLPIIQIDRGGGDGTRVL